MVFFNSMTCQMGSFSLSWHFQPGFMHIHTQIMSGELEAISCLSAFLQPCCPHTGHPLAGGQLSDGTERLHPVADS